MTLGEAFTPRLIGGGPTCRPRQAWEKIANELLAARAAQPKLKKAA